MPNKYSFDTGTMFVKSTYVDVDPAAKKDLQPSSGENSQSSSSTPPTSGGSSTTQVASKDNAQKEQAVLEYNTLKGELNLRLCTKSLLVRQNTTIQLSGVGNYLSGLYYVEKVRYSQSNGSAFQITASLIKTGFGDSLKSNTPKVVVVPDQRAEQVETKATGSVSSSTSSSSFKNGSKKTIPDNSYMHGMSVGDEREIVPLKIEKPQHEKRKQQHSGSGRSFDPVNGSGRKF